jgi:hypothetical protein
MKHLVLFLFFGLISFSASAQCTKDASAGKACCAAKKATASTGTSTTQVASVLMEADAAVAASNGTVTKRTCETSGTASYYQKSTCSHSGTVTWEEVKYDATTKKFTKVASASMEKDANGKAVDTKTSCSKAASGKACCATKKGV